MSQISAQGLRKTYGKRTVVHDVSFEVNSGEVVGLLGPNGAGKTTCFYMVVGLVAADGGSVRMDTHDLTHMAIHQRARLGLSYLPQEPSIFRKMTVEENIRAILELKPYGDDELDEHLDNLLEDLHIAHLREASAISLSGGERRRVEIARALATNPRFILLDEPFAGVDPIAVIDIQKLVHFLMRARHRRAHHRPQRARDAGHLRPRLHHQRRPRAGRSARPTTSSRTTTRARSTWAKTSACDRCTRKTIALNLCSSRHDFCRIQDS